MLAAPTKSRCPWNLQWGQRNRRPAGFGTRPWQVGQEVLDPAHILLGDALGVSDHQNTNLALKGKGDYPAGSLVLSLVDAATVTGLGLPFPGPVAAPSPRAPLPRLGCAACRPSLTGLLVA
jgi:hypothetical protein